VAARFVPRGYRIRHHFAVSVTGTSVQGDLIEFGDSGVAESYDLSKGVVPPVKFERACARRYLCSARQRRQLRNPTSA